MVTVTQICHEKGKQILVYGCGSSESRGKKICAAAGVTYIQKPVVASALKALLPSDN